MTLQDDIKHIINRLEIDGTQDDELAIVHRNNGGPFRRVLLHELPSGTIEPSRYLTGATLRKICEAALGNL